MKLNLQFLEDGLEGLRVAAYPEGPPSELAVMVHGPNPPLGGGLLLPVLLCLKPFYL